MPDVGVRELKIKASEIIRSVRELRTRFVITHRGRPVALLMPLDETSRSGDALANGESTAVWEQLSGLGEEISRGWHAEGCSTEILSASRR